MSSAYANSFNCSLPIFIPLGTIFIFCITFCNANLIILVIKGHPVSSLFYFQKKDDNVPSILTTVLVFCAHVLHIFIDLVGILNSFIHSHSASQCIESYAFWKSINKCTLWLYSQSFSFVIFNANMLSVTELPSLNPFR